MITEAQGDFSFRNVPSIVLSIVQDEVVRVDARAFLRVQYSYFDGLVLMRMNYPNFSI